MTPHYANAVAATRTGHDLTLTFLHQHATAQQVETTGVVADNTVIMSSRMKAETVVAMTIPLTLLDNFITMLMEQRDGAIRAENGEK